MATASDETAEVGNCKMLQSSIVSVTLSRKSDCQFWQGKPE
jgi:hypothetical protein